MAALRPAPRSLPSRPRPAAVPRSRPAPNVAPRNARASARPAKAVAAKKTAERKSQTIGERLFPVCLLTSGLFLLLTGRLLYIQVIRHKEYVMRAAKQREGNKNIPARRGALIDREGHILVQTEPTCDVVIDPNTWFAKAIPAKGETVPVFQQRAITGLSKLLPGVDVAAILQEKGIVKGSTGRYRTVVIARQQTEELSQTVKKANLLGVNAIPSEKRVAVDGEIAPQVIGFTGRDGNGLHGLELRLDTKLAGKDGKVSAEFDPKGRTLPGTVRNDTPVQRGQDTIITLDSELQHVVQESLGKQFAKTKSDAAVAVVLDPKTGDVVALANYPMCDINDRSDDMTAWMNRAVSAPYEPGSTLKAITFAAALEEKIITPSSYYDCPGFRKIGKYTIHCHDNEVHHGQTATEVMGNSCNIGTSLIARDLKKERLYYYMDAFGFGKKCDSGMPGESRGRLTPSEAWSDIQFANISFGQGISVTPLQLAAAYGAIANDGLRRTPRILWGERLENGEMRPFPLTGGTQVVSPTTARTLRKILESAMEQGTGKPARLDGYSAAGKTGTAQVAENGHFGRKFVSSFIGMAPANNPQYVILVTLMNPKGEHYGGKLAGPVFREIAEAALLKKRVARDFPPLAERIKAAQLAKAKHSTRD